MAAYSVLTWDTEAQAFTPQDGVPEIVHGVAGLRHAIRLLESMGYGSLPRENMPSVLIERIEPTSLPPS